MPTSEGHLEALGLHLGLTPLPIAAYVLAARSGDLRFVSKCGAGSWAPTSGLAKGTPPRGRLL